MTGVGGKLYNLQQDVEIRVVSVFNMSRARASSSLYSPLTCNTIGVVSPVSRVTCHACVDIAPINVTESRHDNNIPTITIQCYNRDDYGHCLKHLNTAAACAFAPLS